MSEKKIEEGKVCAGCDNTFGISAGQRILCPDCADMATSDMAVTHWSKARCPSCRHEWDFWPPQDESHVKVTCSKCEFDFVVRVIVRYESPSLLSLKEKLKA